MNTETQRKKGITERLAAFLNDRRGFTLVEQIVAVFVVLLVSSMLIVGTDFAVRTYGDVTDNANAEVLLSTVMTTLRTELLTATDVTVSADGKSVQYYKGALGTRGTIRSDATDETIYIKEFNIERQLISDTTATNRLNVTFESAAVSDGTVTFYGIQVSRPGRAEPFAYRGEYVIVRR